LERFAKLYTVVVLLSALLLATVPLGWCEWQGGAWGGGTSHSPIHCDW